MQSIFARIRSYFSRLNGTSEEVEMEHMWAWSITSRLAALPAQRLVDLEPDLADLIRSAKELHPEVTLASEDDF